MRKSSSGDVPPPDFDVPVVPLFVIVRHQHRRHIRGTLLGYLIGAAIIAMAFLANSGIVLWFGLAFMLATWDLGNRVCRKQGCRSFGRGR